MFWAVVMALVYIAVTLYITIQMFNSYNVGATFDLGAATQELKYTLQGKMLYSPGIGTSQFAIHFSPILLILVPIYRLFPHPQMLIVVQSLLLALGGYLVYVLCREYRHSQRVSLILEGLYFINPLVWGIALVYFHEAVFAIPALLLMFLGMKRKNYFLFSLGLIVTLSTKEDVVIVLGVFGFILMIFDYWKQKRIERISIIIFCTAILTYGMGSVISQLASAGNNTQMLSYITIRYAYIGKTMSTAIPLFFNTVFSMGSLFQIGAYLAPLAFLPLLSPKWVIPGLVVLLEGILSTDFGQHSMLMQYTAAAIPFLFLAFIDALPRVTDHQQIQAYILKTNNRVVTYAVMLLAVVSLSIVSEGMINNFSLPNAHDKAIYQVISMIPDNTTVTTSVIIFPHLCSRTDTYVDGWEGEELAPNAGIINGDWGFPDKATEYIVFDTQNTPMTAKEIKLIIEQYTLIKNIDGVMLYQLN